MKNGILESLAPKYKGCGKVKDLSVVCLWKESAVET